MFISILENYMTSTSMYKNESYITVSYGVRKKIPRNPPPSLPMRGRVRVRLGIGLGLESGELFFKLFFVEPYLIFRWMTHQF